MKKEPSGRSSVQVEVEVAGSTQSAAERRSAEAQVRAGIAVAPASTARGAPCDGRCESVLPTAHEVVYEYRDCFVISYSPSEPLVRRCELAIRGCADGVRLYFNRGKGLPDPEKLLQGSGGQTRWIHVDGCIHTGGVRRSRA